MTSCSLLGCMVETIINHSNCIAQSHWPVMMMIIIITNEEKKFFSFWPDRQEKIFELASQAFEELEALCRITLLCKTSFRLTNFQRYLMMMMRRYQINRPTLFTFPVCSMDHTVFQHN